MEPTFYMQLKTIVETLAENRAIQEQLNECHVNNARPGNDTPKNGVDGADLSPIGRQQVHHLINKYLYSFQLSWGGAFKRACYCRTSHLRQLQSPHT